MSPSSKKRLRRLSNGLSFAILIGIMTVVLLWDLMVHTTPVGHVSVVWHRMAWSPEDVSDGPLDEGVHVILPWDKFYTYDSRLQTFDQVYEVVSRDGLHMEVTLTFRWRAVERNIVELNTNVGLNYLETLLVPVVGSVAREVVSRHEAEKLYSVDRSKVQTEIYTRVVSHDYPNGIGKRTTENDTENLVVLEDTLIKSVRLPRPLQEAIEQKLEQAQRVEEYKFRVETEKLESARKKIEGQGIREFQEIVAPAISESYLRWRGIEATLRLAESNNAKVVVIGNSETGLPLILDTSSQGMDLTQGSQRFGTDIPTQPILPDTIRTGDGEITTQRPDSKGTIGHIETGDVSGETTFVPVEELSSSSPVTKPALENPPKNP
ncbi:prohibitin family protein [Puniceibacterium sediminis]|uniref:Regulator of protease activity HflC, stomatin/prohibitin superfamily n=1 Tax=Puniceibacterium sediminis TaxID=1608407 RepID=A0A238ZA92_9RHOB|nr:prohibitin family protein [Puniceibacterium sediminis]SNR80247.1 Regulator of protease activity HflC, stomatin/prohibitin superfamily [Puniceibacterium sediminis]